VSNPVRSAVRPATSLALVLALALGLVGLAPGSADAQSRMQQNRARMEQVKAEMQRMRGVREGQMESLAEAERQLAVILEVVADAEAQVARHEQAVDDARRRLTELEESEARTRALVAQRAAALYVQGSSQHELTALLAAESPADAMYRSLYLEVVSRADRDAFETVGIAQVAVAGQRDRLRAEEEELRAALEDQEAILADVRALRNERALVVADTDQRLRQLEQQERHLESERRELAALARRTAPSAAGRSAGGVSAGVSAGGWTWPARGTITSEFGRRWGRMHEGIDIGASSGSAVVAARAGRVSHAGRMGGYGNLLMIDHGGGVVTAYAHLSAMSVGAGTQVTAGQRIGSVGCTGSCTGPHLHFEVRVGGVARNPRGFLP
jgi:murein DD-endopeptidase MepM/ murein hydrolase activator NlpD